MTENQIKVNSLEELLDKAKEYVASQGGAEQVSIGKSSTSTGYWTYTKNGLVQSSKGGIAVELRGQDNSSIEFLLESEGEEMPSWGSNKKGKPSPKLLKRALAELNKIVPDTRPKPPQNKTPDGENNFQPHSFSAIAIPCSSLEEVKKQIKDFYQKNREKISKNPDFSQWIEITEIGLFSDYSEYKDGKTITFGPHNTATIFLKGADRTENGKITNQWINLLLKIKSPEWGEWTIDWPEKELKNYWNSLTGNQETKDNPVKNPVKTSPEPKNKSEQIKNLRQEIQALKANHNWQNDPTIKTQIAEKEKELSKLENKLNQINSSSNTSNVPWNWILGIGGVGLLLILIAALIIRRRKKNKR